MLASTTPVRNVVDDTIVPNVEWSLIAPLVILAIGGVLLITVTSVAPKLRYRGFPAWFTILTAVASAASIVRIWDRVVSEGGQLVVGGALSIDAFTLFVWGVICLSVFLTGALFDGYLRREHFDGPDWYVLLLMSASGGMILAASQDLVLSFVGLEILSIAVYVLAALHLRRNDSQEAAFKYFILGALSSALFLYGIALVYGATGSTGLDGISGSRSYNLRGLTPLEDSSLILAGMALILVGFAFKISAVPFHMWTPDVYEGSPSPVVAYMASGVKVAGFAGLIRVFWQGFGYYIGDWADIIIFLAVTSMIVGSLLALSQTNVKRMLAYSSISHAGFILVAVAMFGALGTIEQVIRSGEAMLFYFLAYTLMVVGSFGVATIVGGRGDGAHSLDDYRGLSKTSPVLSVVMAVLLFGQAGVPFTAGFWAKFRVIYAAASGDYFWLAAIAMVAAVISAVLYLRIVVSMFMLSEPAVAFAIDDEAASSGDETDEDETSTDYVDNELDGDIVIPRAGLAAVIIAAVATVVFGVFPGLGDGTLSAAAEAIMNSLVLPGQR